MSQLHWENDLQAIFKSVPLSLQLCVLLVLTPLSDWPLKSCVACGKGTNSPIEYSASLGDVTVLWPFCSEEVGKDTLCARAGGAHFLKGPDLRIVRLHRVTGELMGDVGR